MNLGSLCYVPSGHHCLQPPHFVEVCTLLFKNIHLVAFPRVSLPPFSSFWLGGACSTYCLWMPLGNVCHAGGWHLRNKPCVGFLSLRPSPRYSLRRSRTSFLFLLLKGHCFTRSLLMQNWSAFVAQFVSHPFGLPGCLAIPPFCVQTWKEPFSCIESGTHQFLFVLRGSSKSVRR